MLRFQMQTKTTLDYNLTFGERAFKCYSLCVIHFQIACCEAKMWCPGYRKYRKVKSEHNLTVKMINSRISELHTLL